MTLKTVNNLLNRKIREYRRARDGVKEFYKRRKVYEDFLSELEPLD